LGDSEDQGFSDIAGESDAIQNAINQVAGADIMEGSGSLFNPTGGVSRQDMAVFLDAFLTEAGIELDKKAPKPYNVDEDDIDTPFNDLGRVTFAAYGAINRLYELGVANGTGDGSTFSPNALLSRAQMAVFITRALAHTDARPAGLSVQVAPRTAYDDETPTLQAALRDADHEPIPDALIEVFSAQSHVDAFDDEGECVADLSDEALGSIGAIRCEIDAADEATEPDGNVLLDIDAEEFCLGNTTLWVWTGDIGDEFNLDETEFDSTPVHVDRAPKDVDVASDQASNATFLRYGDTATFEVQVVNKIGDPVAVEGLVLKINVDQSRGRAPNDRSSFSNVTDEYTTDAHGRVELNFTYEDPRPGDDRQGDSNAVVVDVESVENADGSPYTRIRTPHGQDEVIWSDRDSLPWDLSLSQSVKYHEASDEGSGVRHTVRATLVDQYGDPVSGVKVRLWSNANNADGTDADPVTWNDGLGGLDRIEWSDDETDILASIEESTRSDGTVVEAGTDADDALPDVLAGDAKRNKGTAGDDAAGEFTGELIGAIAVPNVFNYADERTTNRRGVATKSYSRDSKAAFAEVIYAAFNHNPDDGDNDYDEGEDLPNQPTFNNVGEDVASPNPNYDPYYSEMNARELDLEDRMIHYWGVKADDMTTIAEAGQRLVAVNLDVNLIVVTSYTEDIDGDDPTAFADAGTIWIATYDSNDQFNVGTGTPLVRVTMSYFESTIDIDNFPGIFDVADLEDDIFFNLEEEPVDEVNKFTNVDAADPGPAGRCVAE
jgi:hypothetical protein